MPYRRGYVPPFPDFSNTGMSYSAVETGASTTENTLQLEAGEWSLT